MIVVPLHADETVYTCTAYLVMGAWKRLWDSNTLVDVGSNGGIVAQIEALATGVGKKRVEQVVLTHGHFDHRGGLAAVIDRWQPRVYAFAKGDGVSHLLADGDRIPAGSGYLDVIHAPGHSQDSLCFYCPECKALFSGDAPLHILTAGGSYGPEFMAVLERLTRLDIRVIYPGHGEPIVDNAAAVIRRTLALVSGDMAQLPAMEGS